MHRAGVGDRAQRARRRPLPGPRRAPGADEAATDAMVDALARLPDRRDVVIGRAERRPPLREGSRSGRRGRHRARPGLRPGRRRGRSLARGPGALSILAASDPGGMTPVPRMYMRKMAVGPGGEGPDRPAQERGREPRGDRRRVRPQGGRRHGDRARPAAPRRPDRRDPRGRRAHQADRRRRHHGHRSTRRSAAPTTTWRSASAARSRASSRPRRCAASAARSRASCGR